MKKVLFLFLIFNSCTTETDYEKYLGDIGIRLSEKYSVVEEESTSAIGDFSTSFDLKISKKDFETIKRKIQLTKNYSEVKQGDFPNGSSVFSTYDKIEAFKIGKYYHYKVDKAKTDEYYSLTLTDNNKLSLLYVEE